MTLCALAACTGSAAQRAARQGDLGALSKAIADRHRAGLVSNAEAVSLARLVAEHELRDATGAAAVDRIRDARPCAHELDDALATRMKFHDDAGAQAALVRVEGGRLARTDARSFLADSDPHWRAVAVRVLVGPGDREDRLRAIVDPDPLVRREAIRAAREAGEPQDLDALFDRARLDPDPLLRTEAVRAMAALPQDEAPASSAAVPRVSDRLRDLWAEADEPLREDIAVAWASPALWNAGGLEELSFLLARGHDPATVEAASAVLRRTGVGWWNHGPWDETPLAADHRVASVALTKLASSIEGGPREVRLQALAQAPLDVSLVLAAVQKASEDSDDEVRVAAFARLAEKGVPGAVAALESLAQPGSPVAPRARFALAVAGDRRIQAWIEEGLAAARPEERLAAGGELAALGVAARGAPLLADSDAGVRVRAACTILMAARGR